MQKAMREIDWHEPWLPIEDGGKDLVAELRKELTPAHILFGHSTVAVARRSDCDDVLFLLDDGTYAVAHLTWSGEPDLHSEFPQTTIHKTLDDFVRETLHRDAKDIDESP